VQTVAKKKGCTGAQIAIAWYVSTLFPFLVMLS